MSDVEATQKNIRTLLNRIGNYTKCPACQTEMWWVTHKNGKKAPYTLQAVVHFNECKAAEGFGQSQRQKPSNSEDRGSQKRDTDPRASVAAPSETRS